MKTAEAYKKFAVQVSDVLYDGKAPYHVPVFFAELLRGIGKTNIKAEDMKKIVDSMTILYNKRVADEKKRDDPKGKKAKAKGKANLAAGKATDNARNNNPAMVGALLGDDSYGSDYGDEYDNPNARRVEEPETDFMWTNEKLKIIERILYDLFVVILTCQKGKHEFVHIHFAL